MYLLYVNEITSVIEDDDCNDAAHMKRENLFNHGCKKCGDLPTFADDSVFAVSSNDRFANQLVIEG